MTLQAMKRSSLTISIVLFLFSPAICSATAIYDFLELGSGTTRITMELPDAGPYTIGDATFTFDDGLSYPGATWYTWFGGNFQSGIDENPTGVDYGGTIIDDGIGGLTGGLWNPPHLNYPYNGFSLAFNSAPGTDAIVLTGCNPGCWTEWTAGDWVKRAPVPEPASLLFLGIGFIGMAGIRRKFLR